MNFVKLGFALPLVAAFGIIACDDTTSADSNDPNAISCKVTQEMTDSDPLIFTTVKGDLSSTTTFMNDNGKPVLTAEFNQDVPENECLEYTTKFGEYLDVQCDGKTISAESTEKESVKTEFFDVFSQILIADCKAINGKKLDPKDVEKAKDKVEEEVSCDTEGEEKEVASDEVTTDDGTTASAKVTLVCKDGKWTPKSVEADVSKGDETATDDADDVESDTNTGDEGAATDEGAASDEE